MTSKERDPNPAGEACSSTGTNRNKKYTSPFSQFDISSTDVLETIEKKHCPTCNKNVRYFCTKCLKLVNCPEGSVPQLKLPVKIDVIKHEQEREGKSTALHAKILAPDDVDVYGFKDMPEYENVDRLLLLFPSPGAKQLSEIDPASFDKLVVIDGTWEQANKMSKSDSPLLRMKRVTIAPHETLFWRHQRKPDDHLATIEAIYYFLREYHETYLSSVPEPVCSAESSTGTSSQDERMKDGATATESGADEATVSEDRREGSTSSTITTPAMTAKVITPHKEWIDSMKLGPYTNQFDDMLWFYKYFYELIQKTYRQRTDGREFTMKHKKNYIKYEGDKEGDGKRDGGSEGALPSQESSTFISTPAPLGSSTTAAVTLTGTNSADAASHASVATAVSPSPGDESK